MMRKDLIVPDTASHHAVRAGGRRPGSDAIGVIQFRRWKFFVVQESKKMTLDEKLWKKYYFVMGY